MGTFGPGERQIMSKALLLMVTPLQAHVAQKALEDLGNPEYDLLFFTRFRNTQTELAFNKLAKHADNAKLFSTNLSRPDLAVQLMFWIPAVKTLKHWRQSYSLVMFGSVDSPFLSGLAVRTGGTLITVDDGSGNILTDGQYFVVEHILRNRLQRKFFGSPSLGSLRNLIETHYTFAAQFENIVPQEKVRGVYGWGSAGQESLVEKEITFVIGTTDWDLTARQIEVIQHSYRKYDVDYYVTHPMQKISLLPEVPELDKKGQLGEDAILEAAGNRNIHLLGTFSTMFVTLGNRAARKTLLIPPGHESYIEIGKKLGCDIVRLD